MHFEKRRVRTTPRRLTNSCNPVRVYPPERRHGELAGARHGTTPPLHSPPLAVAWQDFKGQKYNERLFQTLVILFGIIG